MVLALVALAGPAEAQEKCALAVLHFNLQYCAGGLDGMMEELGLDGGTYDWSDEALQDQIITQSFAPVLDLLDAHPDWTLTLEMQGLMLEVMADRHPDVLDHLRTLAKSGSAEIASFHYSDQLFLAYPREDLERSVARTRATFAALDVPLSGVVFTQEGQFGQGMAEVMADNGYTTAVIAHNLFETQHDDVPGSLFDAGPIEAIIGRGFDDPDSGASVRFTYLDDGELLATNDMSCYLGPLFVHQPQAVADYEAEVQGLIDQGYRAEGVAACASALGAAGVVPAPLPELLDGTWQPENTDNFGLWMGGAGAFGGPTGTEDDNGVLTAGTRAHLLLHAVQAGADAAGPTPADALLDEAWRELALGQVSDATGWNPFGSETRYGLEHLGRAAELATEAAAELWPASAGQPLWLGADGAPVASPADDVDAGAPSGWIPAAVTDGGRPSSARWRTSGLTGLPVWEITFEPVAAPESEVAVTFSWDGDAIRGVRALTREAVTLPVASLSLTRTGLPLGLGVVGLASDRWLVLEQSTVHLAGRFDADAGTVTVEDGTLRADQGTTWRFHVAPSADEAIAAGILLNEEGPVAVSLPPADPPAAAPEERGCGCASTGGSGGGVLAVGLAVLALRRRRAAAAAATLAIGLGCAGLPGQDETLVPDGSPQMVHEPDEPEAAAAVRDWVGAWGVEECTDRSCTDTLVAVFPSGFGWVRTAGLQGAGDSDLYLARVDGDRLELLCDEAGGCSNGGGGKTIPEGEAVVTLGGPPDARTFRWHPQFVATPPLAKPPTSESCCCASYDFESEALSFAELAGGSCATCLPDFASDLCAAN